MVNARRWQGAGRAWREVGVIGRGATSVVYAVVDEAGERGALKLGVRADVARSLEEAARLERYGRAFAARFGRDETPFPVVLDVDPEGSFVVMSAAAGTAVATLLGEGRRPSAGERVALVAQVAEALAVVESAGDAALDLKSDAIFWDAARGRVTLVDWNVVGADPDGSVGPPAHRRLLATLLDALFAGRPVERVAPGERAPARWATYPGVVAAALRRMVDAREGAEGVIDALGSLDRLVESPLSDRPAARGEGVATAPPDPLAVERRRFVERSTARLDRLRAADRGAAERAFVDLVEQWSALEAALDGAQPASLEALVGALHRSAACDGCVPVERLEARLDDARRVMAEARSQVEAVEAPAVWVGRAEALRAALEAARRALATSAMAARWQGRASEVMAASEQWLGDYIGEMRALGDALVAWQQRARSPGLLSRADAWAACTVPGLPVFEQARAALLAEADQAVRSGSWVERRQAVRARARLGVPEPRPRAGWGWAVALVAGAATGVWFLGAGRSCTSEEEGGSAGVQVPSRPDGAAGYTADGEAAGGAAVEGGPAVGGTRLAGGAVGDGESVGEVRRAAVGGADGEVAPTEPSGAAAERSRATTRPDATAGDAGHRRSAGDAGSARRRRGRPSAPVEARSPAPPVDARSPGSRVEPQPVTATDVTLTPPATATPDAAPDAAPAAGPGTSSRLGLPASLSETPGRLGPSAPSAKRLRSTHVDR